MLRWIGIDSLIYDEVSMFDGDLLDKLDVIGRTLRNDQRPFGGIQLLLCGDSCQLPPVVKGRAFRFFFEARCWKQDFSKVLKLTKLFRQSDEKKRFKPVLANARLSRCTSEDEKFFQSRLLPPVEGVPFWNNPHVPDCMLLVGHVAIAQQVNAHRLNQLPGVETVYAAKDWYAPGFEGTNLSNLTSTTCKLKPAAQVRLQVNLDLKKGLAHGTSGTVVNCDGTISRKCDTYYELISLVIDKSRNEIIVDRQRNILWTYHTYIHIYIFFLFFLFLE